MVATAAAQEKAEQLQGRYRIDLMSGQHVEGDVTEQPDGSYQVKTKHGVVVTVKKNEVRGLRPLEDTAPAAGGSTAAPPPRAGGLLVRREITDEEIDAVLVGITATPDEALVGAARDELEAELPLDEGSLEEMKKTAGRDAKVMLKPHFVLVYTAEEESTRQLASRVEAIYRWKVQYMRMLGLPAQRPEYKLEIYYFGTHEEFLATGGRPEYAGYWTPVENRSFFYDGRAHPEIVEVVKRSKDKTVPYEERQRLRNRVERFMEHQNLEVVQHEVGHHIDHNYGLIPRNSNLRTAGYPRWLIEGTTMMFEVPPSSAGASLGLLNHGRLDEYRAITRGRKLTVADWRAFLFESPNFWSRRFSMQQSYPISWAFVYYLWKEQRPQLAKYYQTLAERDENTSLTEVERLAEFENIFGKLDDKFVEKLDRFLDGLQLKKSLLPLGRSHSEPQRTRQPPKSPPPRR